MTALNRLISQAKARPRPAEVTLAYNHLGGLVEAAWRYRCQNPHDWSTRARVEGEALAGTLFVFGVPVRIVGVPPAARAAEAERLKGNPFAPGPRDEKAGAAWRARNPGLAMAEPSHG